MLLTVLRLGLYELPLLLLQWQFGSGFLMQKFSFGDEEKIRTGKKVIRGSLFSYILILAIDLVLSAVQLLIKGG